MRASDFMTTAVLTTTPSESAKPVTRQLLERRIAAMPAVDDDGRLVGIVREVDVLRERVHADPPTHVRFEEPPRNIPVVRGDLLVGIVGRRDLLRLLARDDALIAAEFTALLGAEATSLGDWDVVEGGCAAVPVPGRLMLSTGHATPSRARMIFTCGTFGTTRQRPGAPPWPGDSTATRPHVRADSRRRVRGTGWPPASRSVGTCGRWRV